LNGFDEYLVDIANFFIVGYSICMAGILAIDIGTHYIKVVEGYQKKNRFIVRNAGIIRNPIPYAHLNLNENQQKQFSIFLKNFLRDTKIKRRETVCSIGGEPVIIHYFDIPDIPEDEIKSSIELELFQVVPGGIENLEYDYHIFPCSDSSKRTVLVTGIPKIRCDFYVDTLLMSGLRPIIMDIDGLALVNCYLTMDNKIQKAISILNIGARYTNLAVIDPDGFVFVRDIDFGGDRITSQIARNKGVSISDAEQIKKDPFFKEEVQNIVRGLLPDTLEEVSTSLRYFETRMNRNIERILLTGGSSLIPGILTMIEDGIKISGEIWKPMEGRFENCKTSEPECMEVCFSVALGLLSRKLV